MSNKVYGIIIVIISLVVLTSCSPVYDDTVILYSSSESIRNERFQKLLNEKFPKYKVIIETIPTGENVAKILAEGENTECDIMFDIAHDFMESLIDQGVLEDVSEFDSKMFIDDLYPVNNQYLPWSQFSGCIAVNKDLLSEKNLPVPTSWEDLLDENYRGLIIMPNPKTSGTGYVFLKLLVNEWGEEKAFKYFDDLSTNIIQFTSSGGGPTNALIQKEAAIALCMTYQAAINIDKGQNWDIVFLEGGAPHSSTSNAVIKGHLRDSVREVFTYLYTDLIYIDENEFMPEHGLKQSTYNGYFPKVPYGDMKNNTVQEKKRLLESWKY